MPFRCFQYPCVVYLLLNFRTTGDSPSTWCILFSQRILSIPAHDAHLAANDQGVGVIKVIYGDTGDRDKYFILIQVLRTLYETPNGVVKWSVVYNIGTVQQWRNQSRQPIIMYCYICYNGTLTGQWASTMESFNKNQSRAYGLDTIKHDEILTGQWASTAERFNENRSSAHSLEVIASKRIVPKSMRQRPVANTNERKLTIWGTRNISWSLPPNLKWCWPQVMSAGFSSNENQYANHVNISLYARRQRIDFKRSFSLSKEGLSSSPSPPPFRSVAKKKVNPVK
ncbi:hypothetical protein CEXT_802731 [Caerostris extrusa]|uniref:Uncharacterized protein n=1 Tax=Caerostris extrusa TaxID=172846 RepID=A0AAV4NU84_CAEEX|nr:hypothetical protein CEXT_802731 [Caerostris extrusa]